MYLMEQTRQSYDNIICSSVWSPQRHSISTGECLEFLATQGPHFCVQECQAHCLSVKTHHTKRTNLACFAIQQMSRLITPNTDESCSTAKRPELFIDRETNILTHGPK